MRYVFRKHDSLIKDEHWIYDTSSAVPEGVNHGLGEHVATVYDPDLAMKVTDLLNGVE